jgi:hypothetical protein
MKLKTYLVTLLHYVKVVTLWLKSSTFALCTSGDVIFVFSLYVELVLLLYNMKLVLSRGAKEETSKRAETEEPGIIGI